MKTHEKLFLKLLQKGLKVTARGCFAGSTSLAYICRRPSDHLHWNYAYDILNGFFEFKDGSRHSLLDLYPCIQLEEMIRALRGPDDLVAAADHPAMKLTETRRL